MKQKEKSEISRERILNAAIHEFGAKGYKGGSLNNICSDNKISKGLIYHYYKNKDELFLAAVKFSVDSLLNYVKNSDITKLNSRHSIEAYFDLRFKFFNENQELSLIFFNAALQPPLHLKCEILEIRKELEEFNIMIYKKAISEVTLRDSITEDEALYYFKNFLDMYHTYIQSKNNESDDISGLIERHEFVLRKALDMMFYGIAKEDKQ